MIIVSFAASYAKEAFETFLHSWKLMTISRREVMGE
jgi:hypothetical protein